MKTLQVDKFASGNQPQIGDSKIYTGGPVSPSVEGKRFTRQPPADRTLKIYSKPLPVVSVRLKDADSELFTINESDFDSAIYEKVKV